MNDSLSNKVVSAVEGLLSRVHQRSGHLTDQLERVPGGFGLGQVPARQAPDAVATMVCGFCSTGCGLKVHLKKGEAVNLTPDAEYPVNLGMACPKGWEALRVLKADDRATTPLVGSRDGRQRPVDWDTAMRAFCDRFKAVQEAHGPHSIAVLSSGQIATEEMALLGCLAKFGSSCPFCGRNDQFRPNQEQFTSRLGKLRETN